jgi:hypothetical protein
VCEPESWFKIVAEADRVLVAGGIIIIHDFIPSRAMSWPKWHSPRTSEREQQCQAWLYDFKKLFLGHPLYHQIGEAVAQRVIGELMMPESAAALVKYPAETMPTIRTKEDS